MSAKRFVIAGAGIGGLTAAIALAQDGHEVEVVEQTPEISVVGAGVTLAPNAMRAYGHLGLEPALCAVGVQPVRQRVQHWKDGRTLLELERGESMRRLYGASYIYIHRADLHDVLTKALRETGRGAIRLGATAVGAVATATGAALVLDSGEHIEGDVLVGADGVKSAVRRVIEADAPVFTGHIVWRAVVPVEGAKLRELADYPGVHIGPGRMAVRYPVGPGGGMLNLVFYARQEGWAEEGWTIPAKISELENLYRGWDPELGVQIAAIDETKLNKWAVMARRPMRTWIRDGRITVLGDAAHAMTPFMGQGACAAIEDALILARAFRVEDETPAALARYEAARLDRCSMIQTESNANADRMQGDETELFGMGKVRNEETLGLFAYDAGTVEI